MADKGLRQWLAMTTRFDLQQAKEEMLEVSKKRGRQLKLEGEVSVRYILAREKFIHLKRHLKWDGSWEYNRHPPPYRASPNGLKLGEISQQERTLGLSTSLATGDMSTGHHTLPSGKKARLGDAASSAARRRYSRRAPRRKSAKRRCPAGFTEKREKCQVKLRRHEKRLKMSLRKKAKLRNRLCRRHKTRPMSIADFETHLKPSSETLGRKKHFETESAWFAGPGPRTVLKRGQERSNSSRLRKNKRIWYRMKAF